MRTGWLRTALATLLVGACVLNVLVKNGVSTTLSEPVSVSVPLVGIVQVLDGRDLLYSQLVGRGYPTPVPPSTLPAFQKGWGPFNERIARVVTRYAAQKREPPYVVVGTGDYFINDTRLDLAFELMNRRPLRVSLIAAGVDTEAAYRRQLSVFGNNFLLTSDAPRLGPPRIARATLEAAARASGFNPAASFRTPDGREAILWWRGAGGETGSARVGIDTVGSRPQERQAGDSWRWAIRPRALLRLTSAGAGRFVVHATLQAPPGGTRAVTINLPGGRVEHMRATRRGSALLETITLSPSISQIRFDHRPRLPRAGRSAATLLPASQPDDHPRLIRSPPGPVPARRRVPRGADSSSTSIAAPERRRASACGSA